MKRFFFFLALVCAAAVLFAQTVLPEHQFAYGRWAFNGPRLYQNDTTAGLAKMNLRIPQSGPMIYEFNAQYEDGLETGHGGFGLHIFEDSAFNGASWGAGNSYLLWLNYDENPITPDIPRGFSAQVYRSRSNTIMDLVENFDLNEYLPYISLKDITQPVPIKIWVNGDTGEVRAYDPSDPDLNDYFYFFLDQRDLPLRGNWVSLRTNGVSMSFDMGL